LIDFLQPGIDKLQLDFKTATLGFDRSLQPTVRQLRPMAFVLGLGFAMQAVAVQDRLQVPKNMFPVMHQTLPGSQQVSLYLQLRCPQDSEQVVGAELCQVRRINTVGLDRLAVLSGDGGRLPGPASSVSLGGSVRFLLQATTDLSLTLLCSNSLL
jgi:hypothetical protein